MFLRERGVVGLGGAGVKFVEHLQAAQLAQGPMVVIDHLGSAESASLSASVSRVDLSPGHQSLEAVLRSGTQVDPETRGGQVRLQGLASWRVAPASLDIPLNLGSGAFRALGRSLSLPKFEAIRQSLLDLARTCAQVCVVSSTSGGNGSSLVVDVVETLLDCRSDLVVQVIWVNRYPGQAFYMRTGHAMNAAASLVESLTLLERRSDASLSFSVVDAESTDWLTSAAHMLAESELWATSSSSVSALRVGLEQACASLRTKSREDLRSASLWSRSRPINEACGLSVDARRRLMRGYITAACAGAIELRSDEVSLIVRRPNGQSELFRPINPVPSRSPLLPSVIESAVILRAIGDGDAIDALEEWADEQLPLTRQAPERIEPHDPVGYDVLYLGRVEPQQRQTNGEVNALAFLGRQTELIARYRQQPYDGTEGITRDGLPNPPELLFRDIAEDYEVVLLEMSTPMGNNRGSDEGHKTPVTPVGRRALSLPRLAAVDEPSLNTLRSHQRSVLGRLSRNRKPNWMVRYILPVTLVVLSVGLFVWAMFANGQWRQSLADSSTVVAGAMGGFAVCLGAIALISTIQNNSVSAQRTDRLFLSCVGVSEAVTMFDVALTKARLTPFHAANADDDWSHPSVLLAAHVLGERLKTALDDGLFRLLSYRDSTSGSASGRLEDSLALQVFVVFDDLARIDPNLLGIDPNLLGLATAFQHRDVVDNATSARPVPVTSTAQTASADNIQRLACRLAAEIEKMTYRDMARSLRSIAVA